MRVVRRTILSSVLAIVALMPAHGERARAQPDVVFEPVPGSLYREFVAPRPVSGHALVGITVKPTTGDQAQDTLHVYFHKAYKGQIRLELTTADGYLRGEGAFQGETGAGTWARVSIAAPRDARIRAARGRGGPDTLAVAARSSGSAVPHVAVWGKAPADADNPIIRLYVNGRRGDMFVRLGPKGRVACQPITGMTVLSFDRVCDFPRADLPRDRKITLVRRDGFDEDPMPPVTVP